MGGATIQCADFEGNDKAGSPIVSVLDQAFLRAFGFKRRDMSASIAAKYGKKVDPGWHLYCLHDLVSACEKSIASGEPVQVLWS